MRIRSVRALVALAILAILAAGGAWYLRTQLDNPYPNGGVANPVLVDIPRGRGTREIVRLLRQKNLIASENVALVYLVVSGDRGKLQAGEYLFDRPMAVPEVVEKLVRGIVYLHKFTVPEGLTVEKTAAKWEEQGFGPAADFRRAAQDSVSLIRDLNGQAASLEGYLFPETYFFARGVTARQAVAAMVRRFRSVLAKLEQSQPVDGWPFGFKDTMVLASIVESEAALDDERPLVASVYANRLRKKMLLQCDPTVIYALEKSDQYRGTLTLTDLRFDSPYNTYRYAGLPPGPIANPGYRSFLAAVNPASTSHLYFVRTTDNRHTFSDSLADHNRAVAAYRAGLSHKKAQNAQESR
jgi:UPF0755 protein